MAYQSILPALLLCYMIGAHGMIPSLAVCALNLGLLLAEVFGPGQVGPTAWMSGCAAGPAGPADPAALRHV
jgi:hypothetical protein